MNYLSSNKNPTWLLSWRDVRFCQRPFLHWSCDFYLCIHLCNELHLLVSICISGMKQCDYDKYIFNTENMELFDIFYFTSMYIRYIELYFSFIFVVTLSSLVSGQYWLCKSLEASLSFLLCKKICTDVNFFGDIIKFFQWNHLALEDFSCENFYYCIFFPRQVSLFTTGCPGTSSVD